MKSTIIEPFGFMIEIILFVLAGFFIAINFWLATLCYFLGFVMALIVGKAIAKNAVDKFKEKWKI